MRSKAYVLFLSQMVERFLQSTGITTTLLTNISLSVPRSLPKTVTEKKISFAAINLRNSVAKAIILIFSFAILTLSEYLV